MTSAATLACCSPVGGELEKPSRGSPRVVPEVQCDSFCLCQVKQLKASWRTAFYLIFASVWAHSDPGPVMFRASVPNRHFPEWSTSPVFPPHLIFRHAVEMQVSPMCHIRQKVSVVDRVTVQVDTIRFNQYNHICRGKKSKTHNCQRLSLRQFLPRNSTSTNARIVVQQFRVAWPGPGFISSITNKRIKPPSQNI